LEVRARDRLGIDYKVIAVASMFSARLVGAAAAALVGVVAAAFLQQQRWARVDFDGVPIAALGVAVAAFLGAVFGPRLRGSVHGLDTAILMTLAVVPATAIVVGLLGTIEVVLTGQDVPILAPIGFALFGLLVIVAPAVLVVLPAAVVWSQVTRVALSLLAKVQHGAVPR
jgi:hypothetical protein